MFTSPQQTRSSISAAAQASLSWVLRGAAAYLIPVGIGLVSLLALLNWHDQYRFSDNLQLPIQVLAQPQLDDRMTPNAALAALQAQPLMSTFNTHLAVTPFWFAFDTVHRVGGPEVIEFPSRHGVELSCWDSAGMALLGSASKNSPAPQAYETVTSAKAGFALRLTFLPARLLCRATFDGPGHISVVQWPAEQFALSIDQFHRKSGLLDGGMIVLALFVLIIAVLQRQSLYLVFAGWLILNLRIGAMLAGWDIQWLGQLVPPEWLAGSRRLVVVLYGVSTLSLYQMLLGEHLVRLRQRLPLRIVQWLLLPTLVAAVALPFRVFLPVLWVASATGVFLLSVDLVRILLASRNRVALYFAASLVLAFSSGMAGLIADAFDMRELARLIDSVTAALASSLLAALAVVERARLEIAQRSLAQAELRQRWEAVPAALLTLDLDGHFLSANPALVAMLGGALDPNSRTPWQQVFAPAAWDRLRTLLAHGRQAELTLEQQDSQRRFRLRATLAGQRIEGVLDEITDQVEVSAQMRLLADHDPLTGALNLRGIERAYELACATLAPERPMAVAFLELQRFRLINDLYGHGAAGEVLKQVCERIAGVLVAGQHAGRIGGDTFLLILPDTAMRDAALAGGALSDRIGEQPYLVGDKAFMLRAALGLIAVPPGMRMADAIASAERACRDAQGTAGPALVGFGCAADSALVARLSGPKATHGMFLEMQPITALATPHELRTVDAVLRIREADGSIVAALPLLAAAASSGRAGVIDRWMLTATLGWIERQLAHQPKLEFVCVKVSGAALNDEYFVQDLVAVLQAHTRVAGHLCMAVSERAALQDLDNTRRFMEQVRAFGVKVALDDFGAACTSFSYLSRMPVDLLRIDAKFIADILAQPANATIIEAVVQLARNLGMQTLAGGSHDSATVQVLTRLGVDYARGEAAPRKQPFDAMPAAQLYSGGARGEATLAPFTSLTPLS